MKLKYRRPDEDVDRFVEFPDEYYVSYGQIVPTGRQERRMMGELGYALRIYKDASRKKCVFIDVATPRWIVVDADVKAYHVKQQADKDGNIWTGNKVAEVIVEGL